MLCGLGLLLVLHVLIHILLVQEEGSSVNMILSCNKLVFLFGFARAKDKERETKNLVPDRHEGPSLPVAFDRKLVSVSERQGRRPAASPDTHFLSLPVTCPSSVAAGFLSLPVLGARDRTKEKNQRRKYPKNE